ncbi:carboxypeptidase-like regulatory domain-containing protein [Lutibacter sp. A64]|uniref:carboxypeptidase-like regulatory domain-containing protein n=1 Tax=Lutibacter sp. A64 TaxID=2918526 RepID=UPI001F069F82|nr:carboxypeptidase-like regulatory domain-containing protein [Lutibacter sp. A64]UMB53862.1 carboxypeptidase-like regulatory domain-containing protein [Lutibacter sp. A64]
MPQKKVLSFTLFFIIGICITNAQTITLKGSVKDSLQNPLSYANVLAKPADVSKNLQFSITDNDGLYKLELSKNEVYTISVSYMGFKTASFKFTATENMQQHIVLKDAPNQLQEVVIEMPVTVKEDTITYNTNKFVTGEERKLKNVLKKLPGVEVDKNGGVTVQGKKVTTLLVEGKKFFGGGSKLAVENIPANAVDKIQVIDNYNEIAFLKNVSDTDEMAMNILLKEDKKQFAFGDIEAGKGTKDFYRAHSNLFYYSPKTNVNFIGNLNNTGEKIFTFRDYMSFQGGISAVLKGDGSIYNVSASDFANFMETQDLVTSTNKFGALNITKVVNSKLDISGYAIFSHSKNETLTENVNQYTAFTEEKENTSNSRNILGIGKFNIEYAPTTNQQWYFKTQFKKTDNLKSNNILSRIENEDRSIFSENNAEAIYLNQNIEWHQKMSNKHTFSFAADITFDKNNPTTLWETNNTILQGLIPVEQSDNYNINQQKEIQNTTIHSVFKHYWVLNNFNHIYTTVGNKYSNETFFTEDGQQLANGTTNNFASAGFGNDLDYELNDLFLGVHYKFKTGIFELKQGAFLHNYNWNLNQQESKKSNKIVVLPDFSAEIKFSNSKKIKLNYQLKSAFSDASKLANRFYLQSYNSVYKGNEHLENELYHTARMYYSRFSLYRGLMLFGGINYTKKVKGLQNAVQFNETDQYISPIIVDNASENWSFNLNIDKKIKKFKYGLNTRVLTSSYLQNINEAFVTNKSNNYSYTLSVKTLFDKFPTIEVGFEQSIGNYTSSNSTSKFVTNQPYLNIDYDFLEGFIFSFEYENYNYENKTFNQKNTYQIANTTLSYKNEDSAWSFKIDAQNLFNVKYKQQNSFSSYIISDSKTYILPRIVMFSIGYNL